MDAHPPHQAQPYPCNTILFRAIASEYWVKNGEHKPTVFFRRENSDPNGMSLFDSIEGCRRSMPSGIIYGVRSVHVGYLLDLPFGLSLFPDRDDASHANIRFRDGQPTPRLVDDSPACREIASGLMQVSRSVDYWDADDADIRFQAEMDAKRAARDGQ